MKKIDEILDEILNKRGFVSAEDREEYLSPRPARTYDPFLLDGMKAGVDLLISTARSGGCICIYGDYDADGVTASTIMARGVSELTDNWFFYIPSRFEEGYGLNVSAIDKIVERGADLIITVDCGCVSVGEVAYAKSRGLEVIVTDHHNIEDTIAEGIVIDPKKPVKFMSEQGKKPYPCQDLAGCGVAYKFIQALQRQLDLPRTMLTESLDMVAVGTIGDIVPLRDENRTLVKYGIIQANSRHRPSLDHLAKAISVDEISSSTIAFGIVPHINATGRMASAMRAVELFNSEDEKVIDEKVQELIRCNRERKQIQEAAFRKCKGMIRGDESFIVLCVDDMHEGIAGIVAGRIKDEYQRPVIIVTPSGEKGRADENAVLLKGTGRSIEGVNIYEVLNRHSELFLRFGGHSKACGFLMEAAGLERLKECVNNDVNEMLTEDPTLFEKKLDVDAEITPADVTVDLAKALDALAPFGEENPDPLLRMRNVRVRSVSYMGADMTHARFSACAPAGDSGGPSDRYTYAECVLFQKAKDLKSVLEGSDPVEITGTINLRTWKGQESVQFIVEDIKREN